MNLWVHKVLKRKEWIIQKVKSKYWRITQRFGIEIPKSVEEAYKIDTSTGTNHWTRAFSQYQMPGYSYCSPNMVSDIKMDGAFTRKARLVADGHKTRPPTSITYSSVVSRDRVRIALTIASLNSLHVSACDMGNAYLNATSREKLWTVAGPEFGSDKGSMLIADSREGTLRFEIFGSGLEIYFSSDYGDTGVPADPGGPRCLDKTSIKRRRWLSVLQMMLIYVDDILHIAEDPEEDMKKLGQVYRLKDGVGTSDRYLGGNIERVHTNNGSMASSLSCYDYLINAIQQVKDELSQRDLTLKEFGTGLRP